MNLKHIIGIPLILLGISTLTGCTVNGNQMPVYHYHESQAQITRTMKPLNNKVYDQHSYTQMISNKKDQPILFYRFKNNKLYIQAVQTHTKDILNLVNNSFKNNKNQFLKQYPKSKLPQAKKGFQNAYHNISNSESHQNNIFSVLKVTSIKKAKSTYYLKGYEYVHTLNRKNKPTVVKLSKVTIKLKAFKHKIKVLSYNKNKISHNTFKRTSNSNAKQLLENNHINLNHLNY